MEKIELFEKGARIEHRAYGDFEQLLEDVVEKINEIVLVLQAEVSDSNEVSAGKPPRRTR